MIEHGFKKGDLVIGCEKHNYGDRFIITEVISNNRARATPEDRPSKEVSILPAYYRLARPEEQ